ncbi:MAG TPA: hypothetical protein VFZ66_02995 [Herpetosiphonaceae bacterium]
MKRSVQEDLRQTHPPPGVWGGVPGCQGAVNQAHTVLYRASSHAP